MNVVVSCSVRRVFILKFVARRSTDVLQHLQKDKLKNCWAGLKPSRLKRSEGGWLHKRFCKAHVGCQHEWRFVVECPEGDAENKVMFFFVGAYWAEVVNCVFRW